MIFLSLQIESKPLYRVVEKELVPFLKEERYICLVKCFLDCKDMIKVPEPPNPVRDDEQVLELGPDGLPHTRRRSGELCDPLHELFMPNKKKQQGTISITFRNCTMTGALELVWQVRRTPDQCFFPNIIDGQVSLRSSAKITHISYNRARSPQDSCHLLVCLRHCFSNRLFSKPLNTKRSPDI